MMRNWTKLVEHVIYVSSKKHFQRGYYIGWKTVVPENYSARNELSKIPQQEIHALSEVPTPPPGVDYVTK